MEGDVFFTGDIRTYVHTYGHRDSMTDPAQRAESVKIGKIRTHQLISNNCHNCRTAPGFARSAKKRKKKKCVPKIQSFCLTILALLYHCLFVPFLVALSRKSTTLVFRI